MAYHAHKPETLERRHCNPPVCPRSTADTGRTYLQHQLKKGMQKPFTSPSKNAVDLEKKKK